MSTESYSLREINPLEFLWVMSCKTGKPILYQLNQFSAEGFFYLPAIELFNIQNTVIALIHPQSMGKTFGSVAAYMALVPECIKKMVVCLKVSSACYGKHGLAVTFQDIGKIL